jgi:hypothetical protein
VKTTANTLIPGLLAITVTAMTAGNPASAGDVQTVPVTFALAIDSRDLPDEDEDGIPDIPDFTSDDLIGILIGRVEGTAVSTFSFAGGSNTCGEYNVSGTSWLRQVQQAKILRKGRPIMVAVYGDNVLSPPELSFLQMRDTITVDACWVKLNPGDEGVVQSEYDGDTVGLFVIVTAEFRVTDF